MLFPATWSLEKSAPEEEVENFLPAATAATWVFYAHSKDHQPGRVRQTFDISFLFPLCMANGLFVRFGSIWNVFFSFCLGLLSCMPHMVPTKHQIEVTLKIVGGFNPPEKKGVKLDHFHQFLTLFKPWHLNPTPPKSLPHPKPQISSGSDEKHGPH